MATVEPKVEYTLGGYFSTYVPSYMPEPLPIDSFTKFTFPLIRGCNYERPGTEQVQLELFDE